jgi:hypothetical protein
MFGKAFSKVACGTDVGLIWKILATEDVDVVKDEALLRLPDWNLGILTRVGQ